jgi:hypothetical protein
MLQTPDSGAGLPVGQVEIFDGGPSTEGSLFTQLPSFWKVYPLGQVVDVFVGIIIPGASVVGWVGVCDDGCDDVGHVLLYKISVHFKVEVDDECLLILVDGALLDGALLDGCVLVDGPVYG